VIPGRSGRKIPLNNEELKKRARKFLVQAIALLVFACGCTTEPGLNKAKFAELDRAKQDLKAAIKAGRGCETSDALLQRFVSGTAALKNKMASEDERGLLELYNELVITYQDGLLLCRTRTMFADYAFVPKGCIYVTQELDPVVEKYHLPTERHLYQPTGKHWKSIPGDSPRVVWEQAAFEIKNIEGWERY
jgi:hypothetical protein